MIRPRSHHLPALRPKVYRSSHPSLLPLTTSYSTTTPPNPTSRPPHLVRNGLIAGGLLGAAAVSYRYPEMFDFASGSVGGGGGAGTVEEKSNETFTTRIRTSKGIVEHTHALLPTSVAERILHENEITRTFPAPISTAQSSSTTGPTGKTDKGLSSIVVRYDTNWVASNEPIEDRHAEDVVPTRLLALGVTGEQLATAKKTGFSVVNSEVNNPIEPTLANDPAPGPGFKLFSIMDGHSGTSTSQLLSKTLHPMIVLALRSLYAGHAPPTESELRKPVHPGSVGGNGETEGLRAFISRLSSAIPNPLAAFTSTTSTPINPSTISRSLQSAYLTLDAQITSSPLRLLPHLPNKPGKPNVRPMVEPMFEPALSGSCAITVLVDEEREGLYVASAGDCRAVAGYWVDGDGKEGKQGWRCEVLTEDQMGDNPAEVRRMQAEHPASERDTVIMHGRVQGGLQPTRAFGDSRYKWTVEEHKGVNNLLPDDHPNKRRPSPHHKTPPYVTARPEVTYRSLRPESGGRDDGQLKFVIVATDGLWDSISSEEAVALVASHMEAPDHAPVPASQITSALLPSTPESSARYPSTKDSPGGPSRTDSWVYQDENAATHLIRNSLVGSATKKSVRELLSMKYPVSRWLRDDVTCTVIYFGSAQATGSQPGSSAEAAPVKARL